MASEKFEGFMSDEDKLNCTNLVKGAIEDDELDVDFDLSFSSIHEGYGTCAQGVTDKVANLLSELENTEKKNITLDAGTLWDMIVGPNFKPDQHGLGKTEPDGFSPTPSPSGSQDPVSPQEKTGNEPPVCAKRPRLTIRTRAPDFPSDASLEEDAPSKSTIDASSVDERMLNDDDNNADDASEHESDGDDAGDDAPAGEQQAQAQAQVQLQNRDLHSMAVYTESAANIAKFFGLVHKELVYVKPGSSCEFERFDELFNAQRVTSRPKGANDFFNPYKNGKKPCPCGCSDRNKKNTAPGEVQRGGVLDGFRRTGWLQHGQRIALLVPNSTAVLGRFLFDVYGDDDRFSSVSIQDLVTGYLYCCPVAWLYSVCTNLFVSRLVSDPEELMENIDGHMRSSTMCYRFIYVLDLHCHLHQLSIVYLHCVNRHATNRVLVNGKSTAVRPDLDDVEFDSREDVAQMFLANKARIRNEDDLWNYALERRLAHMKALLAMYQKYFLLNAWVTRPAAACSAILKMPLSRVFDMDDAIDALAAACTCADPPGVLRLTEKPHNRRDDGDSEDGDHDDDDDATNDGYDDRMFGSDVDDDDDGGGDYTKAEDVYPANRPPPPCDPALLACPCNCDLLAKPTPQTINEVSAAGFMRWLGYGTQVFLVTPHIPPVAGILYLWQNNPHDPDMPCPEFVDMETGQRYCCVRAWLHGVYMYLFSEGRITTGRLSVLELRKVLRNKQYAAQCVYIPEYGTTMSHLFDCYRVGVQTRDPARVTRRRSVSRRDPESAEILVQSSPAMFHSRDEMLGVIARLPAVHWPDESPYMRRVRDMVVAVENKIARCREAVHFIAGAVSREAIASGFAHLPLHSAKSVTEIYRAFDKKVDSEFYSSRKH